jgi:transposase
MQVAELFEQKVKPSEVAQRVRVSRKSAAYQWHRLWRDGGAQALAFRGGAGGSRCRMSPRCLEELAVYVEQGPAAHGGVEDQVWAAVRVATLIGGKFHVSFSVSGVTRLMHRLGFSPQVPARRVAERDEQAVTVWKEASWAEVKEPGRPAEAAPVSRTRHLTLVCRQVGRASRSIIWLTRGCRHRVLTAARQPAGCWLKSARPGECRAPITQRA